MFYCFLCFYKAVKCINVMKNDPQLSNKIYGFTALWRIKNSYTFTTVKIVQIEL